MVLKNNFLYGSFTVKELNEITRIHILLEYKKKLKCFLFQIIHLFTYNKKKPNLICLTKN